ncbi:uncharacterized protein LOC135393372 [Ornithodoros turicata]|uniref:uncharacterized protein LOC135393372 n=1 Tax=Ornithodoros turicata TaxID=34597 RepID=UPI0031387BE1
MMPHCWLSAALLLLFHAAYNAAQDTVVHIERVQVEDDKCIYDDEKYPDGVRVQKLVGWCGEIECYAPGKIVYLYSCLIPEGCEEPKGGTFPDCCNHLVCH